MNLMMKQMKESNLLVFMHPLAFMEILNRNPQKKTLDDKPWKKLKLNSQVLRILMLNLEQIQYQIR